MICCHGDSLRTILPCSVARWISSSQGEQKWALQHVLMRVGKQLLKRGIRHPNCHITDCNVWLLPEDSMIAPSFMLGYLGSNTIRNGMVTKTCFDPTDTCWWRAVCISPLNDPTVGKVELAHHRHDHTLLPVEHLCGRHCDFILLLTVDFVIHLSLQSPTIPESPWVVSKRALKGSCKMGLESWAPRCHPNADIRSWGQRLKAFNSCHYPITAGKFNDAWIHQPRNEAGSPWDLG